MKNKIIKLKDIYNKFDTFSKSLLAIIVIVSCYAIFSLIPIKQPITESKNDFLEVSDYKDLSVTDYNFYTYGKNRTPDDDYLILNFSKILTIDEKNRLSFKVVPEESVSIEYGNLNNVVVKFINPSKKDNQTSKFFVLFDGKQLFSFDYMNTDTVPEAEYIIRELGE